MDTKLEVISVAVSDIDRAKQFYGALNWREDSDLAFDDHFRVVQMTPPGSVCSIHFGSGLPSAATPGLARGLYLIVTDIEAARADMVERGATVSEVFHDAEGRPLRAGTEARALGPDPHHRSYASYATFNDPDGNGWVLQEVTERLPGR